MPQALILNIPFFSILYITGFFTLSLTNNPEIRFPLFVSIYSIVFLVYWIFVVCGKIKLSLFGIILIGIICRMLFLSLEPNDDIYRYLWEGKMWLNGINPYLTEPSHPDLIPFREAFWQKINHPDFPAIYPPVAQFWFAFWYFAGKGISIPLILLFKISMVIPEIISVFIFNKFLGLKKNLPVSKEHILSIFFLNPLMILEIAGRGHFESLFVMFLLIMVLGWYNGILLPSFSFWGSFLVKSVSLVAFPIVLKNRSWRFILTFFILGSASMTIWWFSGGGPSLIKFGDEFDFNSVILTPVRWMFPDAYVYLKVILSLAFLLIWIKITLIKNHRNIESNLFLIFGLLLLFLPTFHPWYLIWILPWVSMKRSLPWLLLSGTMIFSYAVNYYYRMENIWQSNWLIWSVQFVPPAVLAVVLWKKSKLSFRF